MKRLKPSKTHRVIVTLHFDKPCGDDRAVTAFADWIGGQNFSLSALQDGEPLCVRAGYVYSTRPAIRALQPFAEMNFPQRAGDDYPLFLDPLGKTIRVGMVRGARRAFRKLQGALLAKGGRR